MRAVYFIRGSPYRTNMGENDFSACGYCKALLRAGCDTSIVDADGQTGEEAANMEGSRAVLKRMQSLSRKPYLSGTAYAPLAFPTVNRSCMAVLYMGAEGA